MDKSDEFRRFDYMTSKMKKGQQEKINPYLSKPSEMLVLAAKDDNGITGKDYYLTPNGIMVTSNTSRNRFYEDKNNFYKFLKESTIYNSKLEQYAGEKISLTSPGIVARYIINNMLNNPAWHVKTQKDVNLYDSFLRGLIEIPGQQFIVNDPFDGKNNYVLMLNYPKAPAKYVTVNDSAIRLSDIYSEDKFVRDEQNYFKFFYNLTQESLNNTLHLQETDKRKKEQGNF